MNDLDIAEQTQKTWLKIGMLSKINNAGIL